MCRGVPRGLSIATPMPRRHGHLDERALAERSNEPPAQTALDACAAIAMGRGQVATLPNAETPEDDHDERATGKPAVAVERDGFNLHAGVRIVRGDDMGRERLVRLCRRLHKRTYADLQVMPRSGHIRGPFSCIHAFGLRIRRSEEHTSELQ